MVVKSIVERLEAKPTLILVKNGEEVLDEDTAKLMLLIDRLGSIIAAAKLLRIPYSRAWEMLARVERILGVRIIIARRGGRGGGGAKLTEQGRELLDYYLKEYWRHLRKIVKLPSAEISIPDFVYAGSHDPLLEHVIGLLKKRLRTGIIETAWVGSLAGILSLMMQESDIAGIHLYDPEKKEYNKPFIEKYGLRQIGVLIRGYSREIGFAYLNKDISDPIEELVSGRLRLVNRNPGSGTRAYLDYLLEQVAREKHCSLKDLLRRIKGYDYEVSTHIDVARAIASGDADIGLTTRWAAEAYGLRFYKIAIEDFDFLISKHRIGKESIRVFIDVLRSNETRKIATSMHGYIIPDDIGEEILGT